MPPASGLSFELRVDFLPADAHGLPGRLGLTRAPGRWFPGRPTGTIGWLRDDVRTRAEDHGANVLVTLVERQELAELGDLRGEARRAGLTWIHFPIPDMWVPANVGAARKLVARMVAAVRGGEVVVVHCWGGLGRAGTIAACCLVELGVEPERAIDLVRAARPGAVQTEAQEQFVRAWTEGRAHR
jgi:ADP-ribosyl-[dinitrogen reductase] hydrolase